MEKEVIFGAPSAHNLSQNVSQILVQKQLFTSGFTLVAESRFAMTTERATNQTSNVLIRVMVLNSAAAFPTAVATIT